MSMTEIQTGRKQIKDVIEFNERVNNTSYDNLYEVEKAIVDLSKQQPTSTKYLKGIEWDGEFWGDYDYFTYFSVGGIGHEFLVSESPLREKSGSFLISLNEKKLLKSLYDTLSTLNGFELKHIQISANIVHNIIFKNKISKENEILEIINSK